MPAVTVCEAGVAASVKSGGGLTVNVPLTYATTKPVGATAPEHVIGNWPIAVPVAVVEQVGLVTNAGVAGLAVNVKGGNAVLTSIV